MTCYSNKTKGPSPGSAGDGPQEVRNCFYWTARSPARIRAGFDARHRPLRMEDVGEHDELSGTYFDGCCQRSRSTRCWRVLAESPPGKTPRRHEIFLVFCAILRSNLHQLVQFRRGGAPIEKTERASLRDFRYGIEKTGHCRAIE